MSASCGSEIFKDFLLMYDVSFCIQKYRLGKQSGKDMGEASRDGRFAVTLSPFIHVM